MIDLNQLLKENRLTKIVELIFPQIYYCSTIKDFRDNKDIIYPTNKIIPFGIFFYGLAVINFPTLRYNNRREDIGVLIDLTGELEININPYWGRFSITTGQRAQLENKKELHDPWIIHRPRDGMVWLFDYKEYSDLESITSKEMTFSFA